MAERRREEVRAHDAPKHLTLGSGSDAGGEQGRGRPVDRAVAAAAPSTAPWPPPPRRPRRGRRRPVDRAVAAAGDLVQRTEREAAARESRVHVGKSEGQYRCGAPMPTFNTADLGAQGLDGGRGPHGGLLTSPDSSTIMFLICSICGHESQGLSNSVGGTAWIALEMAGHWPYSPVRRSAMAKSALKSPRGRTRAQRLETRVTAEQKNLIERAAALQGRSLTDFVLTSVQDAARRAIEEHHQLELSVRDSEAFVNALLNPKPVNDRLRETVRRYREATGV